MPDSPRLTHLDDHGAARMVNVGEKTETARTAVAEGRVYIGTVAAAAVAESALAKGDALAVARVAGIMGAKRTPDLVPLCHPIPLTSIELEVKQDGEDVWLRATVRTTGRTGVEMEALTAVAVAGLTVIDMVKKLAPEAEIRSVHVVEKLGGEGGPWHR